MFGKRAFIVPGVIACLALLGACFDVALAQETRGFKFNNLSVSPYVTLEYRYDSNVNYDKEEVDDNILSVNPGVDLSYRGNDWGLTGNGWFAYDWYTSESDLNAMRYGEKLQVFRESAKGWKVVLGQSYLKTNQDDSILDGGNGLWRDRDQLDFTGALSYEFSERMRATLSAQYSDLNYANDSSQYGSLYGWEEWSVGTELAHKLSQRTDLLLSGSYQQYASDGANGVSSSSTGYTIQAGVASRATERIRYHVLTGVSWFDYADGDMLTGWTYSLDASWMIARKWALTVAGSSQYQPSEQEENQAVHVYSVSAGLTYEPWQRLKTRLDMAYRREDTQYSADDSSSDTSSDLFSGRIRADYQLRRFTTLYGAVDYENRLAESSDYSYDRVRLALGVNFRY